MKAKAKTTIAPASKMLRFTEDDIRDYAYHLYVQSGCAPGHDLENWLDAKSCLEANIPKERSDSRSQEHRHPATAANDKKETVEEILFAQ